MIFNDTNQKTFNAPCLVPLLFLFKRHSMVLSAFQAVWHLSLGSNNVSTHICELLYSRTCGTPSQPRSNAISCFQSSVSIQASWWSVTPSWSCSFSSSLPSLSSPFSGRGCRPWVDLGHGLLYLLELLSTVLPEDVQFDDLSNVALTRRAITPATAPLWSQWSHGSWVMGHGSWVMCHGLLVLSSTVLLLP